MFTVLSRVMALASKRDAVPRGTTDGRSHLPGVPDELAIEIDANGSPVTVEEADWFVCFVPGLQRQWWHRFTHPRHKHVFALRMVDDDTWLLVEPWWTRLMVNVLRVDEAIKFLRWGAAGDILRVRESIPGRGSQARGWSNCTVLVSFLLGRSYWTWTPHGLFRRLQADPSAMPVELSKFLREHFQQVASRNADKALALLPGRSNAPLQEVLQEFGTGVLSAIVSPSAIALYKAAVSESGRFRGAADALWTFGPGRVAERIRESLEHAQRSGETTVSDCAAAAHRFMAMLRGDLHLEVLFGLRAAPDSNEIRAHVASVVDVFLRGAWPNGRLQMLRADEERAASTMGSSAASQW